MDLDKVLRGREVAGISPEDWRVEFVFHGAQYSAWVQPSVERHSAIGAAIRHHQILRPLEVTHAKAQRRKEYEKWRKPSMIQSFKVGSRVW